jgi:hypothetical protein
MYNQLGITSGLQEAAVRAAMFTGANQGPGGTTTTVGLATTYTGLVLSNPANSGKNLALYEVNVAVVGAPTALSTVGLLGGYVAAGLVTHTTPLTVYSNILGIDGSIGSSGHATSIATIDAAATLPSTPVLLRSFATIPITGATAQVVNPPISGVLYNAEGNLIIEPGGFVAVYTSTVLTIIASMTWTELVP